MPVLFFVVVNISILFVISVLSITFASSFPAVHQELPMNYIFRPFTSKFHANDELDDECQTCSQCVISFLFFLFFYIY